MGDRIHEQCSMEPRGARAGERTRTAGGTRPLFSVPYPSLHAHLLEFLNKILPAGAINSMTFLALISQLWEFCAIYRSHGEYALLKYFNRFFYLNNVYEMK